MPGSVVQPRIGPSRSTRSVPTLPRRARRFGGIIEDMGTASRAYADRLVALESVWWKRVLPVQAPYRWNLRRQRLGRTLDVGCGVGRNLATLGPGSVGVDHNATSVLIARGRGHQAFTVEGFGSPRAQPRTVRTSAAHPLTTTGAQIANCPARSAWARSTSSGTAR